MAIFSWDKNKAAENVEKHGVSFEDAITAFLDPLYFIADEFTVGGELRKNLIGCTDKQLLIIVVHLDETVEEDEEEHYRIISARKATPSERRKYANRAEEDGYL